MLTRLRIKQLSLALSNRCQDQHPDTLKNEGIQKY